MLKLLKLKLIDIPLIVRVITMITGFGSTLILSKTLISAYGIDGIQVYGIWLALSTFGGLIEMGRFSAQMSIINDNALEENSRVMLLQKLYARVGVDCIAISIPLALLVIWQIDQSPILLFTMISTTFISLFSQFVLKEKIARGFQTSFIILSSMTQFTTPAVLILAVKFNVSEESGFILMFVSSALITSATAFHSFYRQNGFKTGTYTINNSNLERKNFASKWFFAVTIGLGLLSTWDRIWASAFLNPDQFAQFAIIQVFLLSSLNLLSISYQRLWRQIASNQNIDLSSELKRNITHGMLLSCAVFAATILTNRIVFENSLNAYSYGFICSAIILGTSVQNVFSARLSHSRGFRILALIIVLAVVFRAATLLSIYSTHALTAIDLFMSSAITLILLQMPFTTLAQKKFRP